MRKLKLWNQKMRSEATLTVESPSEGTELEFTRKIGRALLTEGWTATWVKDSK